MQVFKTFFRIAKKYIGSSLIYLGVFVFMCMMFMKSGANTTASYSMQSCDIAVFDRDNSEESKHLIEYISKYHKIVDGVEDDVEVIKDYLYYRKLDYVLYIEKGFGDTYKVSNYKRMDTNVGAYVTEQIDMYLSTIKALKEAGYDEDNAYELTISSLDSEKLVTMQDKTSKNPGYYYFFVFMPYVLLMMMLTVLTPIVLTFNKKEVKNRFEISSYSSKKKSFELSLAILVATLATLAIFIILDLVICGDSVQSPKNYLCILNITVFALVAASLVSIVGNFNVATSLVGLIANIVGLSMAFIGGIFVPVEFFGKGMYTLAHFMPTFWYLKAQDNIMKNGIDKLTLSYMGIELLFAVCFFSIAFFIAKKKRVNA